MVVLNFLSAENKHEIVFAIEKLLKWADRFLVSERDSRKKGFRRAFEIQFWFGFSWMKFVHVRADETPGWIHKVSIRNYCLEKARDALLECFVFRGK